MRYFVICLTFLMLLSPALIAQSTRLDELDIPDNKKKECSKMLANVRELLKSEQNSEALKEVDKLIAYEPKYPWSYMNKALALYRLDSLDECMVLCKTGYDSYGDNHLSWLLTGRIYKYNKKYDEALMCFVESCKKDPRETIGLYEWIRMLVELKRSQEALSEISYFAHKSGKSDKLWGMLAWAHLQLNNIDSAIYYADKSISICSYNDIGLEWDFSKTDAWLAKATLTPQQHTLIEDITKRFKEYVGKK